MEMIPFNNFMPNLSPRITPLGFVETRHCLVSTADLPCSQPSRWCVCIPFYFSSSREKRI